VIYGLPLGNVNNYTDYNLLSTFVQQPGPSTFLCLLNPDSKEPIDDHNGAVIAVNDISFAIAERLATNHTVMGKEFFVLRTSHNA
jgi:hypothetical protein